MQEVGWHLLKGYCELRRVPLLLSFFLRFEGCSPSVLSPVELRDRAAHLSS